MKKQLHIAIAASILMLTTACMKKDLEVNVHQTGCSQFNISNAGYVLENDPSCTGVPLTATAEISFAYTGNDACLDRILIDAETEFRDSSGKKIQGMDFAPVFFTADSLVRVDRGAMRVTFRFAFTFPTAAEAGAFNSANIVFHCENSQGDASRQAKVHFYGACARPVTTDFPVQTVNVNGNTINVKLWDNASQDGDIVSVFLNGVWVLQNFMLTNAGSTFTWPILENQPNDMVLIANNQGSVGPNTCSITLNGTRSFSFDLDLSTGQVLRLL